MSKVLVLMSTWNGELFLKAQLESIFAQMFDGSLHLLVRDDGSNDSTLDLLDSYQNASITVVRGKNIGAKASFLELIRMAQNIEVDFYALSDQDDVWDQDKIACAINCIRHMNSPALYCSSVEIVSQDLSHLSNYIHPGDRSFPSTLLCNYVTGCTSLFNRALLEKIRFPSDPGYILMHDWWLGLTASAIGEVFYDDHSHIKHRQHGGNHVGITRGLRGLIRRFTMVFHASKITSRVTQSQSFAEAYNGKLSEFSERELHQFLRQSRSLISRLNYTILIRSHVSLVTAVRFVLFS